MQVLITALDRARGGLAAILQACSPTGTLRGPEGGWHHRE